MSKSVESSRIADIVIPINDYQRPKLLVEKEEIEAHLIDKGTKQKISKEKAKEFKAGYKTFPYFIGRQKVIEKLKDRLTSAPDKGASYLLVGARGAGKTTVVNKAIQELQVNEEFKYRNIDISLSNENFEEIDIYRIVGKRFIEIFFNYNRERLEVKSWLLIKRYIWVFAALIGICLLFNGGHYLANQDHVKSVKCWLSNAQPIINLVNDYAIPLWTILPFFIYTGYKFYNVLSQDRVFKIWRKARQLRKRIEAETSTTESLGVSAFKNPFNLGFQQTSKYPIADIRFIEHELIMLLREVNEYYEDQKFIFIFDELDKIEFKPNFISDERSYEKPEDDNLTRRRQRAVIEILGNFKYFLNHAQAKFIFIAGSEISDAAMADISKRDFYLRSIFDEIITLDSLLKEDLKKIDLRITTAVEAYVYGIIIDEDHFKMGDQTRVLSIKKYSLLKDSKNKYFHPPRFKKAESQTNESYYVKKVYDQESGENNISLEGFTLSVIKEFHNSVSGDKAPRWLEGSSFDETRYASFLKDFILYLTFRSHGSPRLLFQYFERYIKKDPTSNTFYLKFNYKQQMVIGFVAHLYRGLIRNFYNTTVGNSDKLLSNLPFIFDHVLKFHDFAFSWRSLELLPEVIDVNKSPKLRTHVNTIVDYLTQRHVTMISNGLFEYKFTKTAVNEIRFVSEISKTSRAAFNFTLDESLPLKKYYEQRIARLKKDLQHKEPFEEYIHSLGFYYLILGDLHFYDKEYDKAIENYNNAVQPFRQKTLNRHNQFKRIRSHEFIIYIRGMLRMNLTFERMKLYDSVFTYLEWTNRFVVNYFNLRKRSDYLAELRNPDDFKSSNKFQLNNQQIFIDGFLNVLYVAEKASVQGVTQIDISTSRKRFKKIIDQPFDYVVRGGDRWYFAMLKAHYNNQLGHLLFYKNGFLPGRKIQDPKLAGTYEKSRPEDEDVSELLFKDIKEEFKIKPESGGLPKYYNIPISAYYKYYRCLYHLLRDCELNTDPPPDLKNSLRANEVFLLKRYAKFLYAKDYIFPHNYQSNLLSWVANYLADFGNTILCLVQEHEVNSKLLINVLKKINDSPKNEASDSGLTRVFTVKKYMKDKASLFLLFTYLSGLYYKRINRQTEYAYALTKILYLFRYNATIHGQKLKITDIASVYEKLVFPAFKATFLSCRFKDVEGVLKWAKYDDFMKNIDRQVIVQLVQYPEIKDIVIVFFELLLACSDIEELKSDVRKIIECDWVGEHIMINNSFSRTMELRFKVALNKVMGMKFFKIDKSKEIEQLQNYCRFGVIDLIKETEKSQRRNVDQKPDILLSESENKGREVSGIKKRVSDLTRKEFEKLYHSLDERGRDSLQLKVYEANLQKIADSLWCLRKIRTNLQVYGISYITNHYFRAETSHTMANLLEQLDKDQKGRVTEILLNQYKVTMDEHRMDEFLNPAYHEREALKNYRSCIQMHSQGECYYKTIRQMYYLEGDFDDSTAHFCATLDRYRINTGNIGKKIEDCL